LTGAPDETSELFTEIVRELPHKQRIAVRLCFYEKHTQEEASPKMNCSQRYVSTLLTKAIRTLRKLYLDDLNA